jgi:DNA-binding MarR family transcriptional regulator
MPLDPQIFRGLSDFRQALRRFLAASEAISRDGGVTQQQYQALLAIKASAGEHMSMSDLADQLLLTHHAAVQMVDRLAKAGLARREPSERDRRQVRLALSAAGDQLVAELAARHLAEMQRQAGPLKRSLSQLTRLAKD